MCHHTVDSQLTKMENFGARIFVADLVHSRSNFCHLIHENQHDFHFEKWDAKNYY